MPKTERGIPFLCFHLCLYHFLSLCFFLLLCCGKSGHCHVCYSDSPRLMSLSVVACHLKKLLTYALLPPALFLLFPACKAVGRGDKRTQPLRVRVLALRENPWRVRVIEPALLENPRRDRVIAPALREKPSPRTSARSLVRGSRLSSGHPRPRSMVRVWNEDKNVHWWVAGASNHGSKWN